MISLIRTYPRISCHGFCLLLTLMKTILMVLLYTLLVGPCKSCGKSGKSET